MSLLDRRLLIGGAIAAAALVVVATAAIKYGAGPSDNRVTIALNLPLTGPIASFSGQYPNGLQMGVEDGCKALNIDCKTFRLLIDDNAGKPQEAASVFEKQRLAGFDVYISGTSDMSSAIAKQLDDTPVPHLIIAFDAFITSQSENRLRILPNYKIEGPAYVNYARARAAKKVVAITLNNAAIQEEFSKLVEPQLKTLAVDFRREVFDWGFSDYNTLAARIKTYDPDLILISGFAVHILPSLRALRAQGLIGDGNVLCTMDFLDLLSDNTPIAEVRGVASIAPAFELPDPNQAHKEWVTRFQQLYRQRPTYVPGYAYDTGQLLVQAFHKEGRITKSAMIRQLPFQGITGTIEVDNDGDLSTPLRIIQVGSDGKIVVVK